MTYSRFVREIASALLAGAWTQDAMALRLGSTFGSYRQWMDALALRVLSALPGPQFPNVARLEAFLRGDDALYKVFCKKGARPIHALLTPTPMAKAAGRAAYWEIPALASDGDLCRWLDVTHEHLACFANAHSREATRVGEPLRHYAYTWIRKRTGGWRLLEIPKSKLKEIQRRILRDLLDKIPPHPNARGFAKGGSVLRFVEPHVRRPLLLRMDLKDFFISIQASRVHALFRTAGYSEHIARMLTGLCTNSVPTCKMRPPDADARLSGAQQMQLRTPHLPQGAPTSPALANLCAFRFDARATGLAKKYGYDYSRYADDLLFSGPARGREFVKQFQIWVGAIALEEHFEINMRKTRAMRRSARQHAAGLVLNERPAISRAEYDALKATLHNCVTRGPESQNRAAHAQFRAHLSGRINYMATISPQRGERLRAVFERIEWEQRA